MNNTRLLVSLAILLLPACKKITPAMAPQDQLTMAKVFADDTGAQSAMTGYYIDAMNNSRGFLNGGISIDAGLAADELDCTPPYPAADDSFRINALSSTNTLNTGYFTTAYHLLLDLNSILVGLSHSTSVSAPVRAQLTGETEFNRALIYFYLVNLYGDVPLVLETNYQQNQQVPRTPADSVYSQIVKDILDAVRLLPADYIMTPGFAGDRTRPNQGAALALLARIRLFRGQWPGADSAATAVIGNPRYGLESNLDSVFLSTSTEAIWQLQPVYSKFATAEGLAFLLQYPPGRPSFIMTPQWLQGVEAGDQRLAHWTKTATYRGTLYTYPYKYKQEFTDSAAPEYEMVLRLAEQVLIRAEARVYEGNLSGAIADVNLIRMRAGLPGTTAATTIDILAAIAQQRRIELFTEWGQRWLDLRRTNTIDAVLGMEKPGWRTTDALWPMPFTELQDNPGMPQNPGY